MPFRYLEHVTSADAAFEAEGATVVELFRSAADALMSLMIENPGELEPQVRRSVWLKSQVRQPYQELAGLLYEFLAQFIYWKDAEQLLLRTQSLELRYAPSGSWVELRAELAGERIDPGRQALGTDVKAVTFHRMRVWQEDGRWKAIFVVDI